MTGAYVKTPVRGRAGFGARHVAVSSLASVLERGRSLDDAFDQAIAAGPEPLEARDRALARLISLTVLRRKGEIAVNSSLPKKGVMGSISTSTFFSAHTASTLRT